MGFLQYLCASSARTTIAAAEPSDTPEQSMIPSGSAILGEFLIASSDTSFWNCALGLRAPFLWFFHAMRVSTSLPLSGSSPYFLKYAGASSENDAGAVMLPSVPSLGGLLITNPEKPESLSFSTPI